MLQIIQSTFVGFFAAERGVVPGLAGWRRRSHRQLRAI